MKGLKGDLDGLKGRVDRHDERLDYLQGNIVDHSTRISAVEDGVKANAKDINVVGTIAMETVNSLAIIKLLLQTTLKISISMLKLSMS